MKKKDAATGNVPKTGWSPNKSLRLISWFSLGIVTGICFLDFVKYPISSLCLILASLFLAYADIFKSYRIRWPGFIPGVLICLIIIIANHKLGLPASVLLLIIGLVLILLAAKKVKFIGAAHTMLLPVMFIAYIVPVKYILAGDTPNVLFNMPMEMGTGMALCLLCLSILCFYPETWLMRVFTGIYAGSIMARKLLVGFLFLPLVIGWLRLMAERTGLVTSEFGVVLVAVTYTFCLLWLAWFAAKPVNRREINRIKTEEILRQNEQRLKYHIENSPLAMVEWDEDFVVTLWSNEAERIFGWNANETIGRKIDSLKIIYEEDIPIVVKTIERLTGGKESTIISSNRNITKSGDVIECVWFNSVLMDRHGQMTSVMSLVQDITERRKAESLLMQSREQYRTLVEMSPYAVFLNRNNHIVYVNPACLDLFGASESKQILGKTPFDLFHSDSHAVVRERIELLTREKAVPVNEEKIIRMDGSIRDVEVAASTFTDQDGQAIQVILHDITENKKAHAQLVKLNQTLKALDRCSQAMVRVDDENSFLQEVCQIIVEDCRYTMVWIGYKLEDEDKTVLPMVHSGLDKGYLESMRISWADTERGQGPTGTAVRTGKVSACRNMLTDPLFTPWREQALNRGYASSIALPLISNDITLGALTIYSREPDSFSQEQIELLTELAKDVAYGITAIRWKIAQAHAEMKLKKYADDLKELNATKDKFFSIIAHDLKNPFASILGTSEILSTEAEEYDPETIKKFSLLMHQAAKNGFAILENLLEWSRSQTGRLTYNPEKLNISELIVQDMNNLAIMAANKGIKLVMSVPNDVYMMVDLNMMHTILRNLLSNAIKFTHHNGKVNISAEQHEKEIIITVKDNGIGIPENEQQKLFRIDVKYTQIGTAEERGTGLGLLLCREFVEKQGGKIWVESQPGKGSSFKFSIPLKQPGKRNKLSVPDFRPGN